jgi:hypothetical protein
MNATISALIIAIVGVLGTLSAAIVSQILSARARREEVKLQSSQQESQYKREQQQKVLEDKRRCYITMITAARRYRLELMSYLYLVNRRAVDNDAALKLEEARLAFNTSIAEAQLTGTKPVRDALEPIRKGMSGSYASIKDLENNSPELNSSFAEIRAYLLELWDEWPRLHETMRDDLGVKD